MKVQDILTDESKWTQRAYARDAGGCGVHEFDETAVKFCIMGAINKAYPRDKWPAIKKRLLKHCDGVHWNDSPNRTFADVRGLIEKLDI